MLGKLMGRMWGDGHRHKWRPTPVAPRGFALAESPGGGTPDTVVYIALAR